MPGGVGVGGGVGVTVGEGVGVGSGVGVGVGVVVGVGVGVAVGVGVGVAVGVGVGVGVSTGESQNLLPVSVFPVSGAAYSIPLVSLTTPPTELAPRDMYPTGSVSRMT